MTQIEMDVARSQIKANKVIADTRIDWEQRLYEVASEIFMARAIDTSTSVAEDARDSILYAEVFIEELKKRKYGNGD